jgi:hypothetical protein
MQKKSYWQFSDPNLHIVIPHVSNRFDQRNIIKEGDREKGRIQFHSTETADEIWGPSAIIEITWETIDPVSYHHGVQTKESIEMYSAINVVTTKKDLEWHQSHEMTVWYGRKQKLKRRRMYMSQIIHSIFFCDQTSRIFNVHGKVLNQMHHLYQQPILDVIHSLQCH